MSDYPCPCLVPVCASLPAPLSRFRLPPAALVRGSTTDRIGSPGLGLLKPWGGCVGFYPLGRAAFFQGRATPLRRFPSAAAAAGRKGGRKGGSDRESQRAGEQGAGGSGSTCAELTRGSAAADRAAAPPRARGIPTPLLAPPALTPGAQPLPLLPAYTHPLPRRSGSGLAPLKEEVTRVPLTCSGVAKDARRM